MEGIQEITAQHGRTEIRVGKPSDYLFRPEDKSFKKAWHRETFVLCGVLCFLFFSAGSLFFLVFGISPFVTLSFLIGGFYLGHMMFKLLVVQRALKRSFLHFSSKELQSLQDEDLPSYTVLVPLYQEAEVVPQIIAAMKAIEYPREKLEILITLEEYDHETREALEKANLPSYFKIITLPDVLPKTKPKALNVALSFAKGELLVIYDAEVIPDADQLKKAALAFSQRPDIACLQTRLDHYNTNQNLLTKFFSIEFNFYYDLFLTGLQQFGFPIPLAGHSTHFRRSAIDAVQGWDPYNVAEDCDMGIALYRKGYRTEILDSMSREEATPTLFAWMRQRSRWMKGFLQSSIVHLRHPLLLKRELGGWAHFAAFMFTVPGTVLINFFNLLYLLLLIGWFGTHSLFIKELFSGPILSISMLCSLGGNAIFVYGNLVASYRRGKYELVKYALLSPFYWVFLAVATGKAVVQLIREPYHWEKTKHGTHLIAREIPRESVFQLQSS